MTTYSFAQLQQLWINAGGNKSLAPYAAATAIIESSGDPAAHNPSGASGLWQLIPSNQHLIPGGSANVFNAADNAKGAVALSGNTMSGLVSNWTNWEGPGAAAEVQSIIKKNGGAAPSSAGTTAGSRGSNGTGTASGGSAGSSPNTAPTTPNAPTSSSDLSGLIAPVKSLLHAVATVIDYAFTMFEPGQGPRVAFGAAAVVAALLAYKVLAGSGGLPYGA